MSDATPADADHGFEDSRRLTGPNRWFGGTAVVLTPLGLAAADGAAQARWAAGVREMATRLGWPDTQPLVDARASGVTLAFAAPADVLFTATEVNEWAWECAAAQAGDTRFDRAQDHGSDSNAAAVFAARAAAECNPALAALRAAAVARGLPVLADDDSVSLGSGSGSSAVWPLQAAAAAPDMQLPPAPLPAPKGVPWATLHGIPTALVTGSNGKTTTVRLLAAIAQQAGLAVGHSSTEGVVVDGQVAHGGDYAGPAGARAVLRDRRVQLAVLETARGGILRRGLAVARADVAVVTNISPDHLGEYGVENADDLAEVKLAVARAVQHPGGTLVLNADDAVLMAAAARLPHAATARQALFALDDAHPALLAQRAAGGSTCGVGAQGRLLLWHGDQAHDLGDIARMPLTLGGAARHNVHNAACAALAAATLGLPVPAIVSTLAMFGSAPAHNPGRLEHWLHHGATVLVDYAHNPDGLQQLLTVAQALCLHSGGQRGSKQRGRLGLLLGQAGNRGDAAIAELGRTAAGFAPDRIVIKELPQMLRGRAPGDVPALLRHALLAAGTPAGRIASEPDEFSAAQQLLGWARPGDVVVLPVHTAAVRQQLAAWLAACPNGG